MTVNKKLELLTAIQDALIELEEDTKDKYRHFHNEIRSYISDTESKISNSYL